MDTQEVTARIERLERENRRLKLAGGAVVAVLLGVALVGAVMPQEIPEVIEARGIRVVDENGTVRAEMLDGGISYYDENGTVRSTVVANGFFYFDENVTTRAAMYADGITYADESGTMRATMNTDGIVLYDTEGNVIWQAPR